MKYLIWILLVFCFIGCKEKKSNKSEEKVIHGISIDSIQIYYTTEWLSNKFIDTSITVDSVKKQFNLINFPSTNFDEIVYIQSKLPNTISITDSILINNLKYCFSYYIDPNEGMTVTDCGLPIYRDIIILYSGGKKIGQIKICFQCQYISVYPKEFNNSVNINDTTMSRFKNYFNKNIHKIRY
jgi:hypothetical protein